MELPPCEVVGQFEMLAGTMEGEGVEVVKKVSVGWRVEWNEEKYEQEDNGCDSCTHLVRHINIYNIHSMLNTLPALNL